MGWLLFIILVVIVITAIRKFSQVADHLREMKEITSSHPSHTKTDLRIVSFMQWLWILPVALLVLWLLYMVCR